MIQIEQATMCANSLVLEMSLRNWLTYLFNFILSMLVGVEWDRPLLATAFLTVFKQPDFILACVIYGIWNKFLLPSFAIEGRCYMSLNMPLRNLWITAESSVAYLTTELTIGKRAFGIQEPCMLRICVYTHKLYHSVVHQQLTLHCILSICQFKN